MKMNIYKDKISILSFLLIFCLLSNMSPLYAAYDTRKASSLDVSAFGADGSDEKDDSAAINEALKKAMNSSSTTVVDIGKGTYYLGTTLHIYSNTYLRIDKDAVLINLNPMAPMIEAMHVRQDGSLCNGRTSKCTMGGYKQFENITIQGGTFDQNDSAGKGSATVMLFRHGANLCLLNLTIKNGNSTYVNLAGTDMASLEGCSFLQSAGKNTNLYTEAVHIGVCSSSDQTYAYPFDQTVSQNISISSCTFDGLMSGVGNHVNSSALCNNLIIKDSTFENIKGYCLNAYSLKGVTMTGQKTLVISSAGGIANLNQCKDVRLNDIDYVNSSVSQSTDPNLSPLSFISTSASLNKISIDSKVKNNGIYIYKNSDISLADLTLKNPGKAGIRIGNKSLLTLTNGTISDTGSHGIYLTGFSNLKLSNTDLEACGKDALYCKESKLSLSQCQIIKPGQNGISLINTSSQILDGLSISSPARSGVRLLNNKKTKLKNLTIKDAGLSSISVLSSTGLSIISSNLLDSKGTGLNATDSTITISGSLIESPTKEGLLAENSKITLKTSQIKKAGSYGISLDKCSKSKILENSISNSNKSGIIIKESEKVTISKNTISQNQGINIEASGSFKQNTSLSINYNRLMSGFGYRNVYFGSYIKDSDASFNTIGSGGIGGKASAKYQKENNSTLQEAPTPEITSISYDKTSKGLLIIFTPNKKANGYYIYRQNKNGEYVKIATVGNGVGSYLDKKKKTSGKSYSYKIVLFAGALESDYSPEYTVTYP